MTQVSQHGEQAADLATVRSRVGAVPDPEIPVVTLAELGILRNVTLANGRVTVTLTPTYSGCPATEAIADDVRQVLADLGHDNARVELSLTPAWTTDWITAEAREKLREYGIAPPCHQAGLVGESTESVVHLVPSIRRDAGSSPDTTADKPACPRCNSQQTELLSEFGSTPCKALYRCLSCAEPFDYFKPF